MNEVLRFGNKAWVFFCVLAVIALGPLATAQNTTSDSPVRAGIPTDWSFRHVVHSRSIDLELTRAAEHEPRVIYEWWHRNGSARLHRADAEDHHRHHHRGRSQVDWHFQLGAGTTAIGMSPVKYSFDISTADCTADYVAYALNVAGTTSQPNIVRLNNIYSGTGGACGANPTLESAYQINTLDSSGLNSLNGAILTSPILSLDGSKLGFIETVTGATRICPGLSAAGTCSIFHVLTWGTTGNNGSFDTATGAYTAVTPGGGSPANNATLTTLTFGSSTTTYSSPWIDYSSDRSFFGDDNGRLYSTTCTFKCAAATPPTIATGWPITIASGVKLSAPVFDSGTNRMFVGGSNGNLYMINLALCPGATCTISQVTVGSSGLHGAILDGPSSIQLSRLS